MIEPKKMTAEELAAAACENSVVWPWQWQPEHMDERHYRLAAHAVEDVPRLLAHVAALDADIADLTTQRDAAGDALVAVTAERDQLVTRGDELRALIVKLTRETPYPAELDECRANRAGLIAEVGTLRAALAKCATDLDAVTIRAADQLLQLNAATERAERAEQALERSKP